MLPRPLLSLISFVVDGLGLVVAARNVFAPGTPLSFIPEDDVFQLHFGAASDPKMAFIFQLFGCCLGAVSAAKLVVVFGHREGTFLRQKLLFVFGAFGIALGKVVYGYSGLGLSVTGGFALMQAVEGAAMVADALRPRPSKSKTS